MFKVHRLNEGGLKKAQEIADAFQKLVDTLESPDLCGTRVGNMPTVTREIAVVRTKLQEACFFANLALALKSENQLA